jgi:hypothetical protein
MCETGDFMIIYGYARVSTIGQTLSAQTIGPATPEFFYGNPYETLHCLDKRFSGVRQFHFLFFFVPQTRVFDWMVCQSTVAGVKPFTTVSLRSAALHDSTAHTRRCMKSCGIKAALVMAFACQRY